MSRASDQVTWRLTRASHADSIVFWLMFLLSALAASPTLAHPMGNFSINHYAHLIVTAGELRVRYRLDLAEIATAQEMPALDADGLLDAVTRWQATVIRMDGRRIDLLELIELSSHGDVPATGVRR